MLAKRCDNLALHAVVSILNFVLERFSQSTVIIFSILLNVLQTVLIYRNRNNSRNKALRKLLMKN